VAHRKPLAVAAAVAAAALVALVPSSADARPIARSHFRGRVIVGGYYSPFYSPFAGPFAFGYGYGYGYPAYGYAPYGAYGYGYGRPADTSAEARIQVTPKEAEVYVDGYRAGRVDDFDGTFQRLHAAPGPHEITLYMNGYRTISEKVYMGADSTIHIKEAMARLAPGETSERPPAPPQTQRRSRGRADSGDDSRDDLRFDSRSDH
jgi:PEGA domain